MLDRVLAYGDHWMPNVVGGDDVLLARVEELRSRADRPVGVTVNAAPSRPERLERYAEAGVERCVFYVPSAGAGRRRGEDRARARLRRAGRPQIAASSSAESPSRPSVVSVLAPSARKSRASTTEAIVTTASIAGVGTPRRAASSVKKISP